MSAGGSEAHGDWAIVWAGKRRRSKGTSRAAVGYGISDIEFPLSIRSPTRVPIGVHKRPEDIWASTYSAQNVDLQAGCVVLLWVSAPIWQPPPVSPLPLGLLASPMAVSR